ncbi:AraC family transcriptional regulator N-terminal domain-containing protein [Methylobacterium aquaticum]|uniref:AraC family transcriptional regulator n=1 Tax=Methylobacterium aquaticum TaxID=270351 RepID=UPI003D17F5E3
MHETLAELAYRHAVSPSATLLPRVTLHIAREPGWPVPTLYQPMLGMVLRGAKRVTIGDRTLQYDTAHYFVGAIDVPVEVAITEASAEAPYVSARLAIDQEVLADLAVDEAGTADVATMGFAVEAMTPELLDSWRRMLQLLDAPGEIATLAPLVEREILFRLLRGPHGAVLRQAVRSDSRIAQVRHVIAHLRANFARPVRIRELADVAGMSTATLHRHFRMATAMSPLQYQKALRLQNARRRLIADDDVAGAAYGVGYESTSQFSREYVRMFGISPGQDGARLRLASADGHDNHCRARSGCSGHRQQSEGK